jgi:glycosyltransferase involved in cell wall biosynthesis
VRVLHFYKTYFPNTMGGVEQVINQLCRGTVVHCITSDVLSLSPTKVDKTIEVDGHIVHRCRSNFEIASTPFSLSAFFRLRKLASEADIIHYHFPYPFTDILHLLLRIKKPTLVTYHSDIIKQKKWLQFYRPLMYKFLNSVDHIIATSPNYIETSGVLEKFRKKISIIPIGIDKRTYPIAISERLDYWQERFGKKFFLFVGVIRYYKGLHILIEAARNSDFPIVILGAGPIENSLKMQAEKLGVHNIHFVGRLSDGEKVALLELSYAIVFPSHLRSEAFGISLLEGAMYGKPLISSEIGTGTSFININNETGLVVPPSDPIALRQAMDYIWNNPDKAKFFGQNAEVRYKQFFTADKMVDQYVELYRKLLDSKKGLEN